MSERIRVEFFGVPRLRTGVPQSEIEVDSKESIALEEIVRVLARRFPEFGEHCVEASSCISNSSSASDRNSGDNDSDQTFRLNRAITANIDGKVFTRSMATRIFPDQTLIIMSSDAGG